MSLGYALLTIYDLFSFPLSVSRHVFISRILSASFTKNYTSHLTCSSPTQSHPKPSQLHGAHHSLRSGRTHHSERDCGGDHLLLHRQHPRTDDWNGLCVRILTQSYYELLLSCSYVLNWKWTSFCFSINRKLCFLVSLQVFPTYHIYPSNPPNVAYMQPKANAPSFFMADELRQVLFSCPPYSTSTFSLPFWRKCLISLPFCPPPSPPPGVD